MRLPSSAAPETNDMVCGKCLVTSRHRMPYGSYFYLWWVSLIYRFLVPGNQAEAMLSHVDQVTT